MNIQKIGKGIFLSVLFIMILVLAMGSTIAEASIAQTKLYKKAFPGAKPKCLICHLDKIPKKADGRHDLNIYGLRVKELAEEPTEETYKEVGSVEDFEALDEGKVEEVESTMMDEKTETE